MARRADHTRDELREMMTQAGLAIIEAQGFEGFSARKIAAQVGYTVGTVYNVFGTHDDLLLSINACTLDQWFTALESAVGEKQGKDALYALALAYIAYAHGHANTWQALFRHTMSPGHEIPQWYAHKLQRFFTLTEQAVMPLCRDEAEAKLQAQVLWAGIHGIATLSLGGKLALVGAQGAGHLAQAFLDNCLRGIEGQKP